MILVEADLKTYFSTTRITELATDGSDSSAVVSARIDALIAAAAGKIYNAITYRYTTAQIDADNSMKQVCAAIVMHHLELRRASTTPEITRLYQEGIAELEALRDGRMKLAAVSQELPEEPGEDTNLLEDSDLFSGMPYTASED